ncbi:MAG: hypothetical protein MR739_03635 [Spirochaetia bacterium]|nr:hypothetical protein [Spirochaetia bacterium]
MSCFDFTQQPYFGIVTSIKFSNQIIQSNQKTGFSGFRRQSAFIPSLRFGTGFASPYNPCHGLKSKTWNFTCLKHF